jgi:hypothetical protein
MFVQGTSDLLPNGRWFMRQDPFPDPGPDGEKPDHSPLPPAAEGDGPADDGSGMDQGLYVCLPAEQLTLAGFAQGGQAERRPRRARERRMLMANLLALVTLEHQAATFNQFNA